jgi:putative redox protein
MAVEMEIVYEGNLKCRATHGPSGNMIQTEAPVDNGGTGGAFSPTDLVGAALASCVMTVMGIVAQRQGIDLRGMKAHAAKEMASAPVRRIGALTVVVTLPPGLTLSDEDRKRLEHAAEICPVKKSLHPDVQVKIDFTYPG